MPISIEQRVTFKNVSGAELFDIYTDGSKHAAAVGADASISRVEGSHFCVFGANGVRGRTLYVAPERIVVQSWRSNQFANDDPDSIVTLVFSDSESGGQIDLFHVNVPLRLYENTDAGWRKMYWAAWKEYLRRRG
jgi:hypothetical protein